MSVLFTAGYEGTDIDRFVRTLKAVGVEQLADVRAVAVSRKAGFSKTKLSERLAAEGIAYTHFRSLGDPKPGREAARAGRFDEFRSIFGAHLATDDAQDALCELTEFVNGKATCLLCFERDPKECHRTIVATEVQNRIGFEVFSLFADDPGRYVRHASRVPRFHLGQGATAA